LPHHTHRGKGVTSRGGDRITDHGEGALSHKKKKDTESPKKVKKGRKKKCRTGRDDFQRVHKILTKFLGGEGGSTQ